MAARPWARALPVAIALLASCSSARPAARPLDVSTACAAVPVTRLNQVFGTSFGAPTPGGASGWIASQCTWIAEGHVSVSLALGSARTLAATGYAKPLATYVNERRTADANHSTVHPLDGIGDGGYYTESGAPKLVGYRGTAIVQLLTIGLDRPVRSEQVLELGRTLLSAAD